MIFTLDTLFHIAGNTWSYYAMYMCERVVGSVILQFSQCKNSVRRYFLCFFSLLSFLIIYRNVPACCLGGLF